MKKTICMLLVLISSLLTSACGGGSGDAAGSNTTGATGTNGTGGSAGTTIVPASREISITEGRVGTIAWSGGTPPFSLKSNTPDVFIKDKYFFDATTQVYSNNFVVVGNTATSNAIQITDSKNSVFSVPVVIKKSSVFTSYPIAADMGIDTTVDFNLSGGNGAFELPDIPVGINATINNSKLSIKVDSRVQNNLSFVKIKRGLEVIFLRINLIEPYGKIDSFQYFANDQTVLDSRLLLDAKLSGLLVKFNAGVNKNRSVRDMSISGYTEKLLVQSNFLNTKNDYDINYINIDSGHNTNLFIIKDNVSYDDVNYFYLNIVGRTDFLNIYPNRFVFNSSKCGDIEKGYAINASGVTINNLDVSVFNNLNGVLEFKKAECGDFGFSLNGGTEKINFNVLKTENRALATYPEVQFDITNLKPIDYSFFTFGGSYNYSNGGDILTVFATPLVSILPRPGINFFTTNARPNVNSGDMFVIDRDKSSTKLTVFSH